MFQSAERPAKIVLSVEAPMLRSIGNKEGQRAGVGAGHLFEMGFLFCRIHLYVRDLRLAGWTVDYLEVASPTVRRFISGKGNLAKNALPVVLLKKFDVMFDNDPMCDKAFAYAMYLYGRHVADGLGTHTPPALRGQGGRRTA